MKTDLKHTDEPDKCWAASIKAVAEDCDHEYYISAMGPPSGTLERARRGRLRILEGIIELERMEQEISCLACHEEVQRQIKLQRDGLLEIAKAWDLSE